jgi:hypothetical protein
MTVQGTYEVALESIVVVLDEVGSGRREGRSDLKLSPSRPNLNLTFALAFMDTLHNPICFHLLVPRI